MTSTVEEGSTVGHILSTSDDLDLLFDMNTGILMDDVMVSPNDPDYFQLDSKTGLTDDVFNELLLVPDPEIQEQSSTDLLYMSKACSPISSDSGISDDQKSPYNSQSEASPVGIEDIPLTEENPLTESYVNSFDLSSILTGSDAMLIDGDLITVTTSDGKSTDMTIQLTETKETVKYIKSATDSLPLFIKDDTNVLENSFSSESKTFPALTLTDEEKKLLDDANIVLPSHYPLTKDEEKSLKAVRRKIRNKISAQDSRKRKKEYVDGLEQRVQNCTRQNIELRRKMERIEKENKTLLDQLKDLKALVSRTTAKSVSASTCVMVLLLSFSLFVAPSFNLFKSSPVPSGRQNVGIVSRTLLEVEETGGDEVSYTTVSPETIETNDDAENKFWRKKITVINENIEDSNEKEMAGEGVQQASGVPNPSVPSLNTQNSTATQITKHPQVEKSKNSEQHLRNDDL